MKIPVFWDLRWGQLEGRISPSKFNMGWADEAAVLPTDDEPFAKNVLWLRILRYIDVVRECVGDLNKQERAAGTYVSQLSQDSWPRTPPRCRFGYCDWRWTGPARREALQTYGCAWLAEARQYPPTSSWLQISAVAGCSFGS